MAVDEVQANLMPQHDEALIDSRPSGGEPAITDPLLDRKAVALRWAVSVETIKRREKDGTLKPIYLPGGRLVRYNLSDIVAIERASTAN